MKSMTLVCILSASLTYSLAQNANKNYLSNRYSLERMGTVGAMSNSVLPGLPMASPDVVGDPFSKPHFSLISALLYNDQVINGVPAKHDLVSDEFYFQTKQGLRSLSGHQIKSFSFVDSITQKKSVYINAKDFQSKAGTPHKGFFEILYDGEMALVKKTEATVKMANYNITLNVGNRDHQVLKKVEYYYLTGDAAELVPGPKTLTTLFGDQKAAVDKYIKINQLNLKDERHLMLVFEYYNQSLAKK